MAMTKMLSTLSDFSTTYPVRYFSVAVGPDVGQPIDGIRRSAKAEPLAVVGEVHEDGKGQTQGDPDRGHATASRTVDDMAVR